MSCYSLLAWKKEVESEKYQWLFSRASIFCCLEKPLTVHYKQWKCECLKLLYFGIFKRREF